MIQATPLHEETKNRVRLNLGGIGGALECIGATYLGLSFRTLPPAGC